jgi:hypothetical protein
MSEITEMGAVNIKLNFLLLGINLALANHHYWRDDTLWMSAAIVFAGFNILSIFLEGRQAS